jgi:hypothetical protein
MAIALEISDTPSRLRISDVSITSFWMSIARVMLMQNSINQKTYAKF